MLFIPVEYKRHIKCNKAYFVIVLAVISVVALVAIIPTKEKAMRYFTYRQDFTVESDGYCYPEVTYYFD